MCRVCVASKLTEEVVIRWRLNVYIRSTVSNYRRTKLQTVNFKRKILPYFTAYSKRLSQVL